VREIFGSWAAGVQSNSLKSTPVKEADPYKAVYSAGRKAPPVGHRRNRSFSQGPILQNSASDENLSIGFSSSLIYYVGVLLTIILELPCDCEVRGHCMCKEMLVIPVDRVVDKKRIIGKKWRAKEGGEAQGVAGQQNNNLGFDGILSRISTVIGATLNSNKVGFIRKFRPKTVS
jgi:hypothetical protein